MTKTLADKLLKELEQAGKIMGKATNGDKKGSQWVFWYIQVNLALLLAIFSISLSSTTPFIHTFLSPSSSLRFVLTPPPRFLMAVRMYNKIDHLNSNIITPKDKADQASPAELLSMDATLSALRTTTVPALKSRFKTLTSNLSTILSEPTTSELTALITDLQTSNAEKQSKISELKAGQDGNGGSGAVTKEEAEMVQREYAYWKKKMGVRKRCFRELEGLLMEGMSRDEVWERVGIEDVEGDGV